MNDPRETSLAVATPQSLATPATETSTAALAARARAEVEARYVMAYRRPRNFDTVRERILNACERPAFAKAARYAKPVSGAPGGKVQGPSIRFAEEAARALQNLDISCPVTFDDPRRLIVTVTVTDLEANLAYSQEVTIAKSIERKKPKEGRRILGERVNSSGELVYLIEATDDEVVTKAQAAISKVERNLTLKHLPQDILEEAMETAIATNARQDAEDPTAARKAMLDSFHGVGVKADSIATYLGHHTEEMDASEREELRAVYQALKERIATWRDILAAKLEQRGEVAPKAARKGSKKGAASEGQSALDKAIASHREKKAAKKAKSKPANAKPPEPPADEQQDPPVDTDDPPWSDPDEPPADPDPEPAENG